MLECYLWYGCSKGTSNRQRRRKKQPRDAPTVPHGGDNGETRAQARLGGGKQGVRDGEAAQAGRQMRGEERWAECNRAPEGGGGGERK